LPKASLAFVFVCSREIASGILRASLPFRFPGNKEIFTVYTIREISLFAAYKRVFFKEQKPLWASKEEAFSAAPSF
jgi:hypothetical protein